MQEHGTGSEKPWERKSGTDKDLYPLLMRRLILPTIALATPIRLWDDYKRGMRAETFSLEELEAYQASKLKEILSHAYDKVPFYRERFREIGFHPGRFENAEDLLRIPPTTKEDIMSNFPEGITAEGMDRSRWKYVATSGTTRQIMGIHDFSKTNANWAAGLRAHKLAGNHEVGRKWMEIPPHMCTNICGIDDSGSKPELQAKKLLPLLFRGNMKALWQDIYGYLHTRRHEIYRRVTLPSFDSQGTNQPEADMAAYIDSIRDYEPYLLEGLPLYIYALAKHLIRQGISSPRVGVIKPFGGSLTPRMKEVIRTGFGCDVFDTYGCSETGFIACDCEKHEGLHLFMDLYHVEVCRNGSLAAPGELGKIYLTDLTNKAMPWIRYDIGDVGRYFVDDHGCGRNSIRLQVEGRLQDTLSNCKGEIFTSDRVFDFFHAFAEIDNFQLIEKSEGKFDLLVVPDKSNVVDKDKIALEFKRFFDANASVTVYPAKTIKSEDGGKFRFVKSKSFDRIDQPPAN